MTVVTVTHADQSKAGKSRIYVGGKNNWQDAIYVGQRCASVPNVGSTIDANMSSKTFADGRQVWFLNSWVPVNGAQPSGQPPVSTPSQGNTLGQVAPAGMQTAPYPPGAPTPPFHQGGQNLQVKAPAGWDIPTGDLSRFASNIVGQAITAGLIKTPEQVAAWTWAAYKAAEALRSGKVDELMYENEPIPDLSGGTDPAAQQGADEEEFEGDSSIPF
jgi:hypothetical protein